MTVTFLVKFWDTCIPTVFCNHPKIYHKVIPSKDADRNADSFNPEQTVSL